MDITLEASERQIVAALLQKMEIAKVASEAAVNAYGQAIGIAVQIIVRARGEDLSAQYTLSGDGSRLIRNSSAQGDT